MAKKKKRELTVDPDKKYCPTCGQAEWKKKTLAGKPIYMHGGVCHQQVLLPNCYIDPTRNSEALQKYKWPTRRPVSIYTPEGCAFWAPIGGEDGQVH